MHVKTFSCDGCIDGLCQWGLMIYGNSGTPWLYMEIKKQTLPRMRKGITISHLERRARFIHCGGSTIGRPYRKGEIRKAREMSPFWGEIFDLGKDFEGRKHADFRRKKRLSAHEGGRCKLVEELN